MTPLSATIHRFYRLRSKTNSSGLRPTILRLVIASNGMGIDPFVDFPGEWALPALGYTQPLQHLHLSGYNINVYNIKVYTK